MTNAAPEEKKSCMLLNLVSETPFCVILFLAARIKKKNNLNTCPFCICEIYSFFPIALIFILLTVTLTNVTLNSFCNWAPINRIKMVTEITFNKHLTLSRRASSVLLIFGTTFSKY